MAIFLQPVHSRHVDGDLDMLEVQVPLALELLGVSFFFFWKKKKSFHRSFAASQKALVVTWSVMNMYRNL